MLKIYNTFIKKIEEFTPMEKGRVKMYTCGPTVYDYIHIGNIRAYLMADIVRRYLEYLGYEVRMIKNITDVGHLTEDDIAQGDSGEDKLLKKALKEKKSPREIADFYEEYFHQVEKEINILPAHYFPKVTAHINQIIGMISTLIEKGYAYEKNGNVFFDIVKFPAYGKLSGNTLENLKVGARLEEHPDKKNPWDFALWLKAPKKHLLKWDSPWSLGYPGWHIECSAMSTEYLGTTIDIHTGGEDNIFPHHEAEIAQTECATGKKFVRYWLHLRLLLVDGVKMSKSKGNFYKLEEITQKGYSSAELRLALLSVHYRGKMNFTWEAMDHAKNNFQRIVNFVHKIEDAKTVSGKINQQEIDIESFKQKFENAMNEDLNTPLALNSLYELINNTNKLIAENKLSLKTTKNISELWKKMNKVFGLIIPAKIKTPQQVKKLLEKRLQARTEKNWGLADELRKNIEEKGFTVEDTKDGQFVKKII